jgi:hypothetical protein
MRVAPTLVAAAWLALGAGSASAQQAASAPVPMPEAYREAQLRMLELQRRMLLAMVDSMPERLYRDRVTPEQRDFAQQIHHATNAVAMVGSRFLGASGPSLPDTAAALNNRAGLRGYVNAVYDWAAGVLRSQSADERAAVVAFFRMQIPRWQVWDELHQHTIWTAGQVVANFRKHGMRPPGFGFF